MAIQATADQGFIRKHNTAVVLDGLRRFAPLSRVELAARTGLNHSTVSLIINKLIKEGFIKEAYLQRPKIGRPGMVLVLNPKGGFTVGGEIGVEFISVILADFVANVLWRWRQLSDLIEDQSPDLSRAFEITQQAIEAGLQKGLRPLGIGVGVPGLVDTSQGRLIAAVMVMLGKSAI